MKQSQLSEGGSGTKTQYTKSIVNVVSHQHCRINVVMQGLIYRKSDDGFNSRSCLL